jgi:hypothetical protein
MRYAARRGERTVAIRAINGCRESLVRKAFQNNMCTLPTPRSPPRPVRYVFTWPYIAKYRPTWGVGLVFQKHAVARRIRPDQRWVAGFGAGGGQRGSIAMALRSLAIDQSCECRASLGGEEARRDAGIRTVVGGEAARYGGGDVQNQPPHGSRVRKAFGGIKIISGVDIFSMSYPTDLS